MHTQHPQEAFYDWLCDSLQDALRAIRGEDARLDHLARSVDHADLKRRLEMHPLFR